MMKLMKDKTKPCPFCGSNHNFCRFYTTYTEGTIDHYYIICGNCGARIGDCKNEEEAIKTWDRRVKDDDEWG